MIGKLKQLTRVALVALGAGTAGTAWAQDDFATVYASTYNRYAYLRDEPTAVVYPESGVPEPASFTPIPPALPSGWDPARGPGQPGTWAPPPPPVSTTPAPRVASGDRGVSQAMAGQAPTGQATGWGGSGTTTAGGPTGQYPAPAPRAPATAAPPEDLPPLPGTTAPPAATAPPFAAMPPAAAPPAPTFAPGLGGAPSLGGGALNMIGDQGPLVSIQQRPVPEPPPPGTRSLFSPSVRGFKIAENQSPIPQDRIFYNFNYFDDVNKKLNDFFDAPIDNVRVYRHVFGLEKTFNGGKGSLGARLPLNTIHADSREANLNQGGTFTSLGNLTLFGKYVVESNPRTGNLFSVGLSITPRTGPRQFAGAPFLGPSNTTTIQPFLAYYLNAGRFFLHGFTALDVPIDFNDVTILYNDVGVGYFLMRNQAPGRFLTAVVPTVEAHVNTPLNHRGEYNFFDAFGTPDILNITSGVNFEFLRTSVLTFGIVTPLTGPRPFDFEAVLLFNLRFGGARTRSIFPAIAG